MTVRQLGEGPRISLEDSEGHWTPGVVLPPASQDRPQRQSRRGPGIRDGGAVRGHEKA